MDLRAICVYCGSSPGALPEYRAAAEAFGARLADEGIALVYGGGNVGLMGALADACLSRRGKVIGVIPRLLIAREVAHRGLTELRAVDTMHERKKMMADLADGFVALPGGVGTLDEMFEAFTWAQIGIHRKPCAFLNVAGYYDSLLRFLDRMADQRFCRRDQLDGLIVETDGAAILDRMRRFAPVVADKWLDRAPPAPPPV